MTLLNLDKLNPRLKPYVYTSPLMGLVVNSPFGGLLTLHCAEDVDRANAAHEELEELARDAYSTGNYETYVFTHARPYRMEALLEVSSRLTAEQWWPLVGHVWRDSNNIWQNYRDWRRIWNDPRGHRELAMDLEDLQFLADLPDTLTIWRGVANPAFKSGLSWTLDRDIAIWFAHRNVGQRGEQPLLIQGRVLKRHVIA